MSHLGDNLSALVDGELSGADLDRASAHLASCDRCRGEAAALRLLKRELRALVAQSGNDDVLTGRLLAMAAFPPDPAGPGGRSADDEPGGRDTDGARVPRPRPAFRTYQEAFDRRPPRFARHRYLIWGAVSLAVVGGVGAAAFTMGGAPGASTGGRGVAPQVELFNVEHAIDSGDVPFPATVARDPTGRATKQAIPAKP